MVVMEQAARSREKTVSVPSSVDAPSYHDAEAASYTRAFEGNVSDKQGCVVQVIHNGAKAALPGRGLRWHTVPHGAARVGPRSSARATNGRAFLIGPCGDPRGRWHCAGACLPVSTMAMLAQGRSP